MEHQIFDFDGDVFNRDSTLFSDHDDQENNLSDLGFDDLTRGFEAMGKLSGHLADAIDPTHDLDFVFANAKGDGYQMRNHLIFNNPDLTFDQQLNASYDNDRFLLYMEQQETKLSNTIRDNKTDNSGKTWFRFGLGSAGIGLGIAGLGWGIPKLVGFFRKTFQIDNNDTIVDNDDND